MDDGHGIFGGGFMWLFWLVIFALIIFVIKGIYSDNTEKLNSSNNKSAIDLLKSRLASGEIDESEYQHLRKEIEKK